MKNIVIADSKGILEPNRSDIDNLMFTNPSAFPFSCRGNASVRIAVLFANRNALPSP